QVASASVSAPSSFGHGAGSKRGSKLLLSASTATGIAPRASARNRLHKGGMTAPSRRCIARMCGWPDTLECHEPLRKPSDTRCPCQKQTRSGLRCPLTTHGYARRHCLSKRFLPFRGALSMTTMPECATIQANSDTNILIVDDDLEIQQLLARYLK